MNEQNKGNHSIEEARSGIESLSNAALLRIIGMASSLYYLGGIGETTEDLLHEAIKRTLSGKRKWRADMGLEQHLVGTIRSIASDLRRLTRSRREVIESDLTLTDKKLDNNPHLEDPSLSLGHRQIVQCLVAWIKEQDGLLHKVLIAQLAGSTRAEIIQECCFSENEFDTVNRRLKRKMSSFTKNKECDYEP